MKIDLYLNGQLVEIDKDIDFVLNKQYTELSDLTAIIVDYSKTISVPMTAKNDELFNYTYKIERQVLLNENVVSYDPAQMMSMQMVFNGSMVMEGYAVLNNVNYKAKTYEINLYGQLGKIFKDMKEKELKNYTDSNNGFWASKRMNTYNVAQSFLHDSEHRSMDWNSNDWYDFWGFAPQLIGNTDLMDTKSYEVNTGIVADKTKTFADTINATRGITYGDTFVGDGLDFNQYQEVRSYMTRPYVYVDKLIQLVQNEINVGDYDGYSLTLDPDWFNNNNPYYRHLCYFPGNESLVEKGSSTNGVVAWDNSEIHITTFPQSYLPNTTLVDLEGYSYSGSLGVVTIQNTDNQSDATAVITLNADGVLVRDRVTGVGSTSGFNTKGKWAYYNLEDMPQAVSVPIRYIGVFDDDDNLIYKIYLCDDKITAVYEDSGWIYYNHVVKKITDVWSKLNQMSVKNITPNSCTWVNQSVSNSYCEVIQQYNFGSIVLPDNKFQFKLQCDLITFGTVTNTAVMKSENINYSNYHTLYPFKNDKYLTKMWNTGATYDMHLMPINTMTVSSNNYRSGSYWNIKDILGEGFIPFTWLIDYAKKFRLFFDIDYMTKTITLKSSYFNTVTYKEVKVDYSKDFVIEPIVNKYKKVNFGYADNNSKKSVNYKKSYGVAYGDQDIYTNIDLNNETMSLIPDDEESVFIPVKMDNTKTWNNLNSNGNIKNINPLYTSKVINTLDKDGNIEYYPFYAFRLANLANPKQSQVPFYWISDDTTIQKNTGEYMYLDRTSNWQTEVETTEGGVNVYYLQAMFIIPQFDNYYIKTNTGQLPNTYYFYWETFQVPKEVYNGYMLPSERNYCIYNARWKNYLNEIFNPNNKKVTCYVMLSFPEFINFKFNQLFVIDNNKFLVNKIIDFNPNSSNPTKVELIQITDADNLK